MEDDQDWQKTRHNWDKIRPTWKDQDTRILKNKKN